MARRIIAWECKYCGEIKKSEKIALRHEASCLKNPDAKNCTLCVNSEKQEGRLICVKHGQYCSRAISAYCDDFVRRT